MQLRNRAGKTVLLVLLAGLILLVARVCFAVTQPIFSTVPSPISPTVDPARLERHVRMLSEMFVPRDWAHPGNLDRTAAYIKEELSMAGAGISEQAYEMDGSTYRNVIGTFGPRTAERVVVGAHYDAFGELPGADDNASGVACLIELAHLLGKGTLPMRVELVGFTLEEPKNERERGLYRGPYGGSAVHAQSLRQSGAKVRLMLSLEMLGYFRDEPGSQRYPSPIFRMAYPSPGNYALIVGRPGDGQLARQVKMLMTSGSALPAYSVNAPASLAGVDWSDHFNYWEQGFPALMVTDTALNRNRNYHTEEDTADRLDYHRMSMAVQGVYAAVLGAAAQPLVVER